MPVTRSLHDKAGSAAATRYFDRARDRLFSDDMVSAFKPFLDDFKQLYYGIAPEAHVDRAILLKIPPINNTVFNAQTLMPYIAYNSGDEAFAHDMLGDLNADDPDMWEWAWDRTPVSDLRRFYALMKHGSKGKIAAKLRSFMNERIEMFCNEAGANLGRLSFPSQLFLMTKKTWRINQAHAKPIFMAAAGNLSVALPMGMAEVQLANRVADQLCAHVMRIQGLRDFYDDFLEGYNLSDPVEERIERQLFMQRHFMILSEVLGIPKIQRTEAKKLTGEAQYQDGVVSYADAPARGINRYSRADVFNIGNHEYGHHLLKSAYIKKHAQKNMRSRVAFNEAVYHMPEHHFGTYQEQYVERMCDTIAAVMFEKMCKVLEINPDALAMDFRIVHEGACKRILSDDEILERGVLAFYRTVINQPRGDGPRVTGPVMKLKT